MSIDPGPHCGVAVRLGDGSLHHGMFDKELPEVWQYIINVQPENIVVEWFATAGRISKDGLYTVELQGSVLSLAWQLGINVYRQTPMDRMPFLAEAHQVTGLNKTKIHSHAVDAVAHLLRWEYSKQRGTNRPMLVRVTE